jgi:nicotinate-nucleotide adenylyltransferase
MKLSQLIYSLALVCILPGKTFSKPIELIPNDSKIRVGIYIGTFDPPHFGHLRVARSAIDQGFVDYVLFLPNDNASHKPLATPFHLRHEMSQMTAHSFDRILTPSVPQVIKEGYVKDILIQLQNQKPNIRLIGMLGADIAKIAEEIFQDQKFWMGIVESFLINKRGGYDASLIPKAIHGIQVTPFVAHDGGLSSTKMRELVATKSSELYRYLDFQVVNTIIEYHLWSDRKSCRLIYLRPAT